MKHDTLRSIAHNLADSAASGLRFLIGMYGFDIFQDAARSARKRVVIDFLKGEVVEGTDSYNLHKIATLYREVLPAFLLKHGGTIDDFAVLIVKFFTLNLQRNFEVTVIDKTGRKSVDLYVGGRRPKYVDELGRIRTNRN
ncbi:MAG: hypothetical protein AAB680_03620 [Pseudomonadota bacterium]